jgi:hypothetical protein
LKRQLPNPCQLFRTGSSQEFCRKIAHDFLLISLLLIPSSLAKSDFLLDQNSFEHLEQLFNVHPLSNYILERYLRQQKDKIIPEQHYPTREEIKNILFHSKDPYENVTGITIDPLTYYSNAARSSDHIEDVILMVFKEYPRIILEVTFSLFFFAF